MARRFQFTVSQEQSGRRLDQIIAAEVSLLSRTRAKQVIGEGGVFVDKKRVKVAGKLLFKDQQVVVHYNEQLVSATSDVLTFDVPIVALNSDYVVVDKPSGLFSAPTPESDRNDLLYLLAEQLRLQNQNHELYPVHRLDRPTSGLMLVARTPAAAANFSRLMESHQIVRQYLALIFDPKEDQAQITVDIDGKAACTHFSVLERRNSVALVRARLETGRTHQVRIHAEVWGSPILGDPKYGRTLLRTRMLALAEPLPRAPRLALHAFELTVPAGNGSTELHFSSPLPEDLRTYWDGLVSAPLR